MVGERIAKVIARSGYCSRREAERLIEEGAVKVNGKIIDSPAMNITDESIKIYNKLINPKLPTKMWLFHKPKGYIVTNKDPQGRKTIFSLLPKNMPRVITIGRLDMDTEGLLLLTNNGELARYIELPTTGWSRQYRVKVHGDITRIPNEELKEITIDGIKYGPIKIVVEKDTGTTNKWLRITINEGKNREVRKIMEYYGLKVMRLIRVSFGPFHLGSLPLGAIKPVSSKVLKESIGNKIKI